MGINKENYEAYFLEYQEGNLSTEQVAELMVFLEMYPELKEELESFELVTVLPDANVKFENKGLLKKKDCLPTQNIHSNNYETWLVAEIEGDLSDSDKTELNEFLKKNPAVMLELNFFRKTILKPESVVFENKQILKKSGILLLYRTQFIYAVSVAASVLLFLGLYFINDFGPNERVAGGEWNVPMQARPFTKLDTENKTISTIPEQRKMEASQRIDFSISEKKWPIRENIARLGFIDKNSLHLHAMADVEFIYQRSDIAFILNESNFPMIFYTEKRSFAGRFLSSVATKLIPVGSSPSKSFLEYSVEGYNLLADREVEVEKQYNKEGKVVAYNVNGEIFNISRKAKSTPQN
jgi:hypothetical protein